MREASARATRGPATREAGLYLNSVIAAGSVMLVDGLVPWRIADPAEFVTYLILAAIAATCKFRLPGLPENSSLAFLVIVIGITNLPIPQALVVGTAAVLVEALWKPSVRYTAGRVLLQLASCAISIGLAHDVSRLPWIKAVNSLALTAFTGSLVFLLANTGIAVGAMAMLEDQPFGKIAGYRIAGAVPYYMAGAAAGAVTGHVSRLIDWRSALGIFTPMFVLYMYYRHFIQQRS